MKPVINAIDLTDALSLVAVWELKDQSWELLMLARPQGAIALCRQQPSKRLVFPTGVSPNGVWRRACIKGSTSSLFPVEEKEPTQESLSSREIVLGLIKSSPKQSSAMLADPLGISAAAMGQFLRKLENLGEIHHRPHPIHSKIRLYYPGTMPSSMTNIPAIASTCKAALPRREPPLKVYFVDPRTLQGVGR